MNDGIFCFKIVKLCRTQIWKERETRREPEETRVEERGKPGKPGKPGEPGEPGKPGESVESGKPEKPGEYWK